MPTAARVVMYATGTCPFCVRAERLLRERGVETIDNDPVKAQAENDRRVRALLDLVPLAPSHARGDPNGLELRVDLDQLPRVVH